MQTHLKITLVDKTLPIPARQTDGSIGFDLYARERTVIPPLAMAKIPANVIVQVPTGTVAIVTPRSSTFRKFGVIMPNSIGIIDRDFCGPEDEIQLLFQEIWNKEAIVERGERIAQLLFVKTLDVHTLTAVEQIEDVFPELSRGGIGSTD